MLSTKEQDESYSWSDAPALIGLISALALVLAVFRQLGFFTVVDARLISLFTVEDILGNSLSTIPMTLFMGVLGFTLREIAPASPPRILNFFLDIKNPALDMRITLLLAVVFILFFENWPLILLFQSIFFFFSVRAWLILKEKSSLTVFIIAYCFMIIVQAYLLGASEGKAALRSEQRNYELSLASGEVEAVNFVRSTSDVFLVVKEVGEMWIVPRAQVKSLKRKSLDGRSPIVSLSSIWLWLKDLLAKATVKSGSG